MVKVSVIVPVYNAEKYLSRCVESFILQTFSEWELLLIDDGSLDKSAVICDDYARRDNRIRVIHKKNGGVSSARQTGLENARGLYVIHADPDDWVEPEMLFVLYNKAIKDNSDIVICDMYWDGEERIYKKQQPSNLNSNAILVGYFDSSLHASCCNKLIRKSLFQKYSISFPLELSLYEDLYVNASLVLNDLKISYCPQAFYHYDMCINTSSITKSIYSDSTYYYDLMVLNIFCSKFKTSFVFKKVQASLGSAMLQRAYYHSSYSSFVFFKKFFKYRNLCWSCSYLPLTEKVKYYLSCIGLYGIFSVRRKLFRSIKVLL